MILKSNFLFKPNLNFADRDVIFLSWTIYEAY